MFKNAMRLLPTSDESISILYSFSVLIKTLSTPPIKTKAAECTSSSIPTLSQSLDSQTHSQTYRRTTYSCGFKLQQSERASLKPKRTLDNNLDK